MRIWSNGYIHYWKDCQWYNHFKEEILLSYLRSDELTMLFIVQEHSRVRLFVTPWTAAHQASLFLTISEWSSCPLHWWCHPAISSTNSLFSFCLQTFPATGIFPMSWLFSSGDQNTGASASASDLPMSIQGWFPLRLTGLVSVLFKGLLHSLKVSILGILASLQSSSHNRMWPREDHSLDYTDFCQQSNVSAFQHTV